MTEFGPHPSEEALECYALGRMAEAEAAALEEHLLICPDCQQKLQETDDFIVAVRRACAEMEQKQRPFPARPAWHELIRQWLAGCRLAYALAGAAALVLVTLALRHSHQPPAPATIVELRSMRGGLGESIASTKASDSLILRVDIRGIEDAGNCSVEIVDSGNARVWSGRGRLVGEILELRLDHPLSPGTYWVRLLSPKSEAPEQETASRGGELVRELGLRIQ